MFKVIKREERDECKKKNWKNNGWQNFNFNENYRLTDIRNSMNSNHKKHEKDCTEAHYNQTV